jgi:hypothetical protein
VVWAAFVPVPGPGSPRDSGQATLCPLVVGVRRWSGEIVAEVLGMAEADELGQWVRPGYGVI